MLDKIYWGLAFALPTIILILYYIALKLHDIYEELKKIVPAKQSKSLKVTGVKE